MANYQRHGLSRTPEYHVYQVAKDRCTNQKHPKYSQYGGRGIQFLFTSFEQFFAELGPKPSPQHSLDRYPNNDGNYEPGNVRWATYTEQNNNTRRKRLEQFSDEALLQEVKRRGL